jgi:hypothetical protein
MTLAPELLDILVCPKCKGDLDYRPADGVLVCPVLPARVSHRRRHPDHADRRGEAGLTAPDISGSSKQRVASRPRRTTPSSVRSICWRPR